ncbi:hypothetical protein BDV32DRAFT_4174 [Aspergillus pseudonomiae]|uniref:Uncharacterized protein n=1 Tax=Aspergillus pseudonomiae TaxID=1506151 RepID=A0A5N6IA43_9EURO|nr:uncharacterized protein BDV37DRAFT_681 [Aspergillus pseudonomiae]KAB8263278.1 hypothetical protein BDV32DRAFT_4174 [Aspergillus pseudonomiae]KAE8409818.1 hypothetical protein BDV37DRAFT_681 [Aspergillus pseudonomiae]
MSHFTEWYYQDWEQQLLHLDQPHTSNPALNADLSYNGFLMNNDTNWASGGFVNGASMEDTLEVPHPDIFSGAHNMTTRSRSTAMMPMAGMPQHAGNRIARVGNADAEDFAISSGASASGPELGSSPPYMPLGIVTGGASYDDSSNNSPASRTYIDLPSYGNANFPRNLSAPALGNTVGGGELGGGARPSSLPTSAHLNSSHESETAFTDVNVPLIVRDYQKLMDPLNNNVDVDTYYASLEEANESQRPSVRLPEDPTIPCTQVQKRAIVKQMCNAMASTHRAQDNKPMIKPFKEGRYSDRRMEAACWQVLETAIERHTFGPLLSAFDVKPKNHEVVTFATRIDKIIECLMLHKTICKHLLDPLYVYHFVDDPVQAEKRVVANRLLNKRKGEVMNAGKQVLGSRKPGAKKRSSKAAKAVTPPTDEAPSDTPASSSTGVEGTLTPDGLTRVVKAEQMSSSPMLSIGTPTPTYTAATQQYSSTPMMGSVAMSHLHNRRMTAPTSHPRPIMMNPNMPYHSRGGSKNLVTNRKRPMGDYEASSPEKRQR